MQLIVDVPNHFLDAMHIAPQDFIAEAKLALAVKLFEMKRLSSGMAASIAGMERVEFLAKLHLFSVSIHDIDDDELLTDLSHA